MGSWNSRKLQSLIDKWTAVDHAEMRRSTAAFLFFNFWNCPLLSRQHGSIWCAYNSTGLFAVLLPLNPLSSFSSLRTLINEQLLYLFYTYLDGVSPVRRISVAATRLADRYGEQLDLFNPPKYDMAKLEDTVDAIRKRFGKTSIMRASSLEKGGTFIERSQLVGGHAGGQSLE